MEGTLKSGKHGIRKNYFTGLKQIFLNDFDYALQIVLRYLKTEWG